MQSFHQHKLFVKYLATALSKQLTNFVLIDAYKEDKTSLVLVFNNNERYYTLKLFTEASQSFLQLRNDFAPRPESVYPLFKEFINRTFEIELAQDDRCFAFKFSHEDFLVVNFFGALLNAIAVKKLAVTSLFRPEIKSDLSFSISNVTLVQPKETKRVFFIVKSNKHIMLLFEPNEYEILFETNDAIEASNRFCGLYLSHFKFTFLKEQLQLKLNRQIKKAEADLGSTQKAIEMLNRATPPQQIADILMANIYAVPKGLSRISLVNFYNNLPVEIKLNPKLDVIANAEHYYKKAKSTAQQITALQQKLSLTQQSIEDLNKDLLSVNNATEIKQLKKFNQQVQKNVQVSLPYKLFEFEGFKILLGKSAADNDELLRNFSNKNDVWLHAKDVKGSHVIIKQKGNNQPSKDVIMFAAQLAAKNSKSKTSSLVPVSYTQRKFVRKPKGALPGQVILEREEVVLVNPLD